MTSFYTTTPYGTATANTNTHTASYRWIVGEATIYAVSSLNAPLQDSRGDDQAKQQARELAHELLTPEQWDELETTNEIEVVGSSGGVYSIPLDGYVRRSGYQGVY